MHDITYAACHLCDPRKELKVAMIVGSTIVGYTRSYASVFCFVCCLTPVCRVPWRSHVNLAVGHTADYASVMTWVLHTERLTMWVSTQGIVVSRYTATGCLLIPC